MPLQQFETDTSMSYETTYKGSDLNIKQVTNLARELIENNELRTDTSVVYIVDLEFYNGKKYINYCRYELRFNDIGTAQLDDYAHSIVYDGNITHVVLCLIEKPKLVCKEPTIKVKRVKFNKILCEHEVRMKLIDIYEKATSGLGKLGFPIINTEKQTFRLKFGYYYMNDLIKATQIVWSPYAMNSNEDDNFNSDEYVELLTERPDHVRLYDVRVDTISLYWLQEWFNQNIKNFQRIQSSSLR
jgi:hypothetical protein